MAAIGESPATYKIPDVGSGAKPFDVIMVGFMDAYVVIKYPQACAIIGIEKWVGESRRSVRRSLTVARAREIAAYWCGDRLE